MNVVLGLGASALAIIAMVVAGVVIAATIWFEYIDKR